MPNDAAPGASYTAAFTDAPRHDPLTASLLANRPQPAHEDPAISALRAAHGQMAEQDHAGTPHLARLLAVMERIEDARRAAIAIASPGASK